MSQVEVTEYIRPDGEARSTYVEVSEEAYEIWKRLKIIVSLEVATGNLIAIYTRFPHEVEEEERLQLAVDHGGEGNPMDVLDAMLKSMAEE